MKIEMPTFKTQKEKFNFLVKNKNTLIAQKKAIIKEADSVIYTPTLKQVIDINSKVSKEEAIKEIKKQNQPLDLTDLTSLTVEVVINTTRILDNHEDVHIDGLWNKSLRENKMIMHLQEHQMGFKYIISDGDQLKAYTKVFSFSELGYPEFEGETESLVFDSTVLRDRNEFMFKQYGKGYVRNHSVGMRYVKLVLCINDKEYGAEYEAWEKYYPMVANKEDAEKLGYFWAVTEAKVIEGSAVPRGSNWVTPTTNNNKISEPLQGTQDADIEPLQGTQKQTTEPHESTRLNYSRIIQNLK